MNLFPEIFSSQKEMSSDAGSNPGVGHETPPFIFNKDGSNSVSRFKVTNYKLTYHETLADTLEILVNEISREIQFNPTRKLIEFDTSTSLLRYADATISIPIVTETGLKSHYMDMEMLVNFLNLHLDHMYFYKSSTEDDKFDESKIDQVKAIIDQITSVLEEVSGANPSESNQIDLDDTFVSRIATKIDTHYKDECTSLFVGSPLAEADETFVKSEETTTCVTGIGGVFKQLNLLNAKRSRAFASVFVHYLLSRLLVIKFADHDSLQSLRAMLSKEILSKAVIVSPSGVTGPAATGAERDVTGATPDAATSATPGAVTSATPGAATSATPGATPDAAT